MNTASSSNSSLPTQYSIPIQPPPYQYSVSITKTCLLLSWRRKTQPCIAGCWVHFPNGAGYASANVGQFCTALLRFFFCSIFVRFSVKIKSCNLNWSLLIALNLISEPKVLIPVDCEYLVDNVHCTDCTECTECTERTECTDCTDRVECTEFTDRTECTELACQSGCTCSIQTHCTLIFGTQELFQVLHVIDLMTHQQIGLFGL
jgi:hypothetical protein